MNYFVSQALCLESVVESRVIQVLSGVSDSKCDSKAGTWNWKLRTSRHCQCVHRMVEKTCVADSHVRTENLALGLSRHYHLARKSSGARCSTCMLCRSSLTV